MDWIWFVLIICIIVIAVKIVEKTNADLKLHFDNVTSTLMKQHNDSLNVNTERKTPIVSFKKQQTSISGDAQTQLNTILSTLEIHKELISRVQTQLELKSSNLKAHVETKNSTLQTKLQKQISNSKALMETKISSLEHNMESKHSDVDAQIAVIRCTSEDEIKTQICTLQTQLQLNNSTAQDQLESKISALEKTMDIKCSELLVKMKTIGSAAHDYVENKLSAIETKHHDLDNETSDLRTQLETIRSTQDHMGGKMSTLDKGTSDLQKQLETIRSTQDNMGGEMSTLDKGTSDLQKQLETIRSTQDHMGGEMSTLDKGTSDLQKQLEIIRTTSLNQIETQISTLQTSLEKTTSDLQQHVTDTQTVVAFTARVNPSLRGLKKDQTVQFQEVMTNIKEAYNPDTGVFLCPISGLYHFSVTILSFPSETLNTALYVSGVVKCQTYSSGTTSNSGSTSAVLRLKAGDDVCVKVVIDNNVNIPHVFSSFSGHLIHSM